MTGVPINRPFFKHPSVNLSHLSVPLFSFSHLFFVAPLHAAGLGIPLRDFSNDTSEAALKEGHVAEGVDVDPGPIPDFRNSSETPHVETSLGENDTFVGETFESAHVGEYFFASAFILSVILLSLVLFARLSKRARRKARNAFWRPRLFMRRSKNIEYVWIDRKSRF